jgi:hypothetical protein
MNRRMPTYMDPRSILELKRLTALSAFAGGAAVAMDYTAMGSLFAAVTLWAVVIGVVLSPVD